MHNIFYFRSNTFCIEHFFYKVNRFRIPCATLYQPHGQRRRMAGRGGKLGVSLCQVCEGCKILIDTKKLTLVCKHFSCFEWCAAVSCMLFAVLASVRALPVVFVCFVQNNEMKINKKRKQKVVIKRNEMKQNKCTEYFISAMTVDDSLLHVVGRKCQNVRRSSQTDD